VAPDGTWVSLLVRRANSAGRAHGDPRPALGGLSAADRDGDGRRDARDLLPGEPATATARLPRRLAELPALVPARRLATHGVLR